MYWISLMYFEWNLYSARRTEIARDFLASLSRGFYGSFCQYGRETLTAVVTRIKPICSSFIDKCLTVSRWYYSEINGFNVNIVSPGHVPISAYCSRWCVETRRTVCVAPRILIASHAVTSRQPSAFRFLARFATINYWTHEFSYPNEGLKIILIVLCCVFKKLY